jgi:transposase
MIRLGKIAKSKVDQAVRSNVCCNMRDIVAHNVWDMWDTARFRSIGDAAWQKLISMVRYKIEKLK